LPVFVGRHDGEEPGCRELLALLQLRGSLERLAAPEPPYWSEVVDISDPELVQELRELIAALDRRVPRVERAGESAIARDAAVLRATAVSRLHELTKQTEPEEPAAPLPEQS
jgi:hypothetical protein